MFLYKLRIARISNWPDTGRPAEYQAKALMMGVTMVPPGGVVLVVLELRVHLLEQQGVRHLPHGQTGLVHDRDQALVLLV